jgi:hypothetical protein
MYFVRFVLLYGPAFGLSLLSGKLDTLAVLQSVV